MEHNLVERSGRSYCSSCNGVEGSSLATECPGRPLTKAQVDGLYRGNLDYRDGEWVNPNAPPEPPDPEPTAQPAPPVHKTVNTTVEVEVDDPDPQNSNDNTPILVPVPVPVPVPMPGGQNTENDPGTEDPDIILDVHRK